MRASRAYATSFASRTREGDTRTTSPWHEPRPAPFISRVRPRIEVRSGGQSGVDRAALDCAIRLGLAYAGWCPLGGWAEDFPDAPGLLARYPALRETPSSDPRQRTAWNVRDSDAVLILRSGEPASPGTDFARVCAELVFVKPYHVQDLDDPRRGDLTRRWLAALSESHEREVLVLSVGGPRESESPGIAAAAEAFLTEILAEPLDPSSARAR
jgi:hypothetical protein